VVFAARRIESMFALVNPRVKQQAIHILDYNLRDNVNAYELLEDGNYAKCNVEDNCDAFNIHEAFFNVTLEEVMQAHLFIKEPKIETIDEGSELITVEQTE